MDVLVLPNIQDQAAPRATSGKDMALVHQPDLDEELKDDIYTDLAGTLLENNLCVAKSLFWSNNPTE